jgi:hypothetical protein
MVPETPGEEREEAGVGRIDEVGRSRRREALVSVTAKTFSPTSLLCNGFEQYIDAGFSQAISK